MERQLGKSTLEDDARRLLTWVRTAAGGLTHNLLSATHTDTTAGAATRGNLIVGNSTPKWSLLNAKTDGYILVGDGTDLNSVAMSGDVSLANTGATSVVAIRGYAVQDHAPENGETLVWSAGNSQYEPGTVSGLPAYPEAAGYALVSTADSAAWDQTPAWTGDHTWDDGTGDSPALKLVGGSNDDTVTIFLDDDASSGQSDLIVRLCDTGGASRLIVQDSGSNDVFKVTSDGNLIINDDSGDSPQLQFVGGTNDDLITMWLDDDATAGDSDLVVRLCDASGDSKLIIQDSGAAEVFSVTSDGEMDAAGHCAIGGAASVAAGTLCYVTESVTATSGSQIGIDSIMIAAPASNFTSSFYAVIGQARLDSNSTQTSGSIIGVYGQAVIDDENTGTANDLIAGLFWPDAEDGTATQSRGVLVYTPNVDTGSVTTGYGISVVQGTVGAGSITTLYGLHMANVNAGGTNYAIYTNAGPCRFGDDVDISGTLTLQQEGEPSDPDEGAGVLWLSNGTGAGEIGDLMWKTKEGGVTKTDTIVDFSAI